MNALLSHLDFQNFKENKSVNKSEEVFPGMKEEKKNNSFIRKGEGNFTFNSLRYKGSFINDVTA